MLHIPTFCYQQLLEIAQQAYPEECCGVMLGRRDGADRHLLEIWPTPNAWTADLDLSGNQTANHSRSDRFWIDPKDLLAAQRSARDRGWDLLGIYHSHPDHPAVPSETDRAMAWPEYVYGIASMEQGPDQSVQMVDWQVWVLGEAGDFEAIGFELLLR
jgi:proteasome lid subunit RPN8/RPN11